jgi:hypothetical protein
MEPQPHADPAATPNERPAEAPAGTPRPVVWPWLVVPAITLAVFFALRSCQQGAMRAPPAATPEPPAAGLEPLKPAG